MAKFEKTVQNFASQYGLWKKDSKIILGISGGPDSMCLLDFFYRLSKKYDLSLHVAHVNYGLRGKDSEKDEELVRKNASKLGVPITVLNAKKNKHAGNLEEELRNIRYAFFEKLRKQLKYELIAVAHNKDDQAETVLMRIIRGAGLSGLAAMRPKSGFIIRPLLKTDRKEIISYLKEKKLRYRIDTTNSDQSFIRNRIRHGLLPYLEKNFNPAIKNTIFDLSLSVANDYSYMAGQAERFRFLACTNKCVSFSCEKFLKKHPAIRNQILRNIISSVSGSLDGIEYAHVGEILKIIKSEKPKIKKALIKGLNISKKGDTVEIFRIN
jgi:tRNA(Ile)-lysidine synthase